MAGSRATLIRTPLKPQCGKGREEEPRAAGERAASPPTLPASGSAVQAPAAGFPNTAPRTGHRACRDLGFSLTLGPGGGGGSSSPKRDKVTLKWKWPASAAQTTGDGRVQKAI